MLKGRGKAVHRTGLRSLGFTGLLLGALVFMFGQTAGAVILTQSGDVNVTATVLPTTPTDPAIIDQPQTNTHVKTTPLVVIGRCGAGLTVRISDNGTLAGSVVCANDNTFTANITLGIGTNTLTALNYDSSNQAGPASPSVVVIVDEPVKTSDNQDAKEEIQQAIGSPDTPTDANVVSLDPSQRIFEGSVVEPLVKLLDINTQVSHSTNQTMTTVVNTVFISSFLLLFILLAF